jgi:hypothetical protein
MAAMTAASVPVARGAAFARAGPASRKSQPAGVIKARRSLGAPTRQRLGARPSR